MRGYDQRVPVDDYAKTILERYKKKPRKLIEQLLRDRKVTAIEYIQAILLFDINKSLKSLLKQGKVNQK